MKEGNTFRLLWSTIHMMFWPLAIVTMFHAATRPAYADSIGAGSGVIVTTVSTGSQVGSTTTGDLAPDALVAGITSASTTFACCGADGMGSADLATGMLKVFADSNDPGIDVLSFAGFSDVLTVTSAGPTMDFIMSLSGDTFRDTAFGSSLARPGLAFSFAKNGSSLLSSGPEASFPLWDLGFVFDTTSGDCNSFRPESGGTGSCTLAFSVPVQLGDTVGFGLVLDGEARDGTVDLSHTLSLNVTGAGFTSQSGVFLTQSSAPIPAPEPSTISLMVTGLAFGGLLLRRRSGEASRKALRAQ